MLSQHLEHGSHVGHWFRIIGKSLPVQKLQVDGDMLPPRLWEVSCLLQLLGAPGVPGWDFLVPGCTHSLSVFSVTYMDARASLH